MDRNGNLVDSMLSEHRDMVAAKRFFMRAREVVGHKPIGIATDGYDSYPRRIRRILGHKVEDRANRYLNNRLEQAPRGYREGSSSEGRGTKDGNYPMRGFWSLETTSRFCSAYDEQRQYFRYCNQGKKEKVPLCEQHRMFLQRFAALQFLMQAA